ncbi:uncharacterized protein LOC133287742 isoform X2 [Gastrolobium bilobum]|uniref:uncharacterized protein LOC133287742 isoform X2 n=1 Tax=Gastrolobium bilobum TaxID=150636 RepID=UPI002AAFC5D4|nr:uncharacterized protein LOC133287742 isoform X2 [Gastrolobium bilobum]
MVRKLSAAKNNDKVLMPENKHPYQGREEPLPSNGNIKSPGALDSQHENPHLRCSPLKYPNSSMEGLDTCHDKSPALEQVIREYEHQKKSATSLRKKSKYHGTSVRRSQRIKSTVVHPPSSSCGIEYIEDITASESEKDEPDNQIEQVLPEPEPEPAENMSEKSLDEKVDYALQRIEDLNKIVELLKSKVPENPGFYEAPSMTSTSYRTDSQKKLEALTDENQRLTGKLENALGKIEVYEKEKRVLIEVLDKMKDTVNAIVVSNLAKTTEVAVNASTQAIHKASAAKRKRKADV